MFTIALALTCCGPQNRLSSPANDADISAHGGQQSGPQVEPQRGPVSASTPMSQTLRGTVTLLGPLADYEICVRHLNGDGPEPQAHECTRTNKGGHWTLKVAGTTADHVLLDGIGGGVKLSTIVPIQPTAGRPIDVAVTPLTHLATGYALQLLAAGSDSVASAVQQAFNEMNAHFGHIPLNVVQPWVDPRLTDDGGDRRRAPSAGPSLTDGMKVHLVVQGLDTLTRRMNLAKSATDGIAMSLEGLIERLYDDIRYDGRFDGVCTGADGTGELDEWVSGYTLRNELAVSIVEFLRASRNHTGLDEDDATDLLRSLTVTSGSHMFASDTAALQLPAPMLAECHVERENGEASSLDMPQAGLIKVHCAWTIHNSSINKKLTSGSIALKEEADSSAVIYGGILNDVVSAEIDTRKLFGGGPGQGVFTLVVSATADPSFPTKQELELRVQSAPINTSGIKMPQSWVDQDAPLRFAGTTDRPLRRVTVTAEGLDPVTKVFDPDAKRKEFAIDYGNKFQTDGRYQVTVALEDWAGNVEQLQHTVVRDTQRPVIRLLDNLFMQELSREMVYLGPSWPEEVPLEKDFSRLDDVPGIDRGAQNLPTLVFTVADPGADLGIGTPTAELDVQYQVVSDAHGLKYTREWSHLKADAAAGLWRLPLSYQSLLPESHMSVEDNFIARGDADSRYTVTIRVTDSAKNESFAHFAFHLTLIGPPVKVSRCGPTGALTGASLKSSNFNWVYERGFDLLDNHVFYELSLPAASLAPRFSLAMLQQPLRVESAINSVRIMRGPQVAQEPSRSAMGVEYEEHKLNKSLKMPKVEARFENVSHISHQETRSFLINEGGQVRELATNAQFEINANSHYILRSRMDSPFYYNGKDFAFTSRSFDGDGRFVIELSSTRWLEPKTPVGRRLMEERVSISGLRMTRPPLAFNAVSDPLGASIPHRVENDLSCMQSMNMQWHLDDPALQHITYY